VIRPRTDFRSAGAWLLVAACGATLPAALDAQESRAPPRLEVRFGFARHSANLCGVERVLGNSVGLVARQPGAWTTAAAVDFFFGGQPDGCLDIRVLRQYYGVDVEIRGRPRMGPRLSLSVSRRVALSDANPELSAGLGTIPTWTDYGGTGLDDRSWQPWFGAGLTLRSTSGMGLQFEIGGHGVPERYFVLDQNVLVKDIRHWEMLWRFGVSIPLAR
jgi:hypothetical protein